ncbi:hypothetical protein CISG_10127 [Coccidioides immitis RMSCC 3703]|uniref:Uncharacterized protein n=2 Tax=Coccidioides immitis TaxID=5501 RepID=A0A0J8QMK0_COCIT|nr:hypothetical protein CISG_10127 [Coccidioides immitis RMSCC 3703]
MKLILDISIITELNYFSLIDVSDCFISAISASAAITCHLYSVPAPSTTAAAPPLLSLPTTASLPFPGADRISTCQIMGIRAPVQFTKPVLQEQEKKKEEKKKKKKKKRKKKKEKENYDNNKNNNDDKNNNNNNDNKLAI